MIRAIYQSLIWLHPSEFRERFGEEMLWIFDESDGGEHLGLVCEGLVSLLRQRLLRSGVWKFGIGAAASGLLILSCGYGLQTTFANCLRRGNPGHLAELRAGPLTAESLSRLDGPVQQEKTGPTQGSDESFIRPVEVSPPIFALKKRLNSGNHAALQKFWRDAANSGAPLLNPAEHVAHAVIATFVWRGNRNVENVGMLAPLANSPGLPSVPLAHLSGTDLWYASWELRDDLRFTYRFVVNLRQGQNAQQFAVIDPLNPRKMVVPFEGGRIPKTELSIASMPRAPKEEWIVARPGASDVKVASHILKSHALGSERKIWVYTPAGYDAKAVSGYPLLVLFDGFSYQQWIPAPTILDNLIYAQKIPPAVAVLIDNPLETRSSDLEYNLAFIQWLGSEFMPWVYENLNVKRDPRDTTIGGFSDGGAAAAFAAMQRPDLFGNVLSQSGSFWKGHGQIKWEFLASEYEGKPKLPLQFFVEAGVLENVSKDGPTLLAANRHLVETLKSKGYQVTYEEAAGTHEPVHWRDTLSQGLMTLLK